MISQRSGAESGQRWRSTQAGMPTAGWGHQRLAGSGVLELLVRCEGQAAADATWVELEALMPLGSNSKHSRTFQLKDTLVVKGGRDVMTSLQYRRRHRKQAGTAASTQPGLSREAQIRLFPFSSSLVRLCQPGVAAAPNLAPVAQIRLFPFSSSLVTVC
jgi:hypothetical protein